MNKNTPKYTDQQQVVYTALLNNCFDFKSATFCIQISETGVPVSTIVDNKNAVNTAILNQIEILKTASNGDVDAFGLGFFDLAFHTTLADGRILSISPRHLQLNDEAIQFGTI